MHNITIQSSEKVKSTDISVKYIQILKMLS
jgi:hypothetical protein